MDKQNANVEPDGITLGMMEELHQSCMAIHGAVDRARLEQVLEKEACHLLEAENAWCFRLEGGDRIPRLVREARGHRQAFSIPVGEGIIGLVAREDADYVSNDPEDDDHFASAIDGPYGSVVRNLASAAMSIEGRVVGVLHVTNSRTGEFNDGDGMWLRVLADHGARAMERLTEAEENKTWALGQIHALADLIDVCRGCAGHSKRVAERAMKLAADLHLSSKEIEDLALASRLHVFGSIPIRTGVGERDAQGAPGWTTDLHRMLLEAFFDKLPLPERLKDARALCLAFRPLGEEPAGEAGQDQAVKRLPLAILSIADAYDRLTQGCCRAAPGRTFEHKEAIEFLARWNAPAFDAALMAGLNRLKVSEEAPRSATRQICTAPMECEVLDPGAAGDSTRTIEAQTIDFGEQTVRFKCLRCLPEAALLKFKIHLPIRTVEGHGRLVWQRPAPDGEGYIDDLEIIHHRGQALDDASRTSAPIHDRRPFR